MDLEFKRHSVATLHDFLDFFDHRAFVEYPDWADCYCQHYLTPAKDHGGPTDTAQGNRDFACSRTESGEMDGYLAYEGNKLVAWCAAGSAELYPDFPESHEKLARILCFVVDPEYRGIGVSSSLLDFIIQDLGNRGFEAIEAYPKFTAPDSFLSYRGTQGMFAKRGFEKIGQFNEHMLTMRKHLN
jgi:ribosomal protein S18 acetylase RimI-like enzyme